ncbi:MULTISPECIES: polysaccharide deacetylase family protein [Vagococcus]|uniref:Polysaccharide deacetylase n=1 Tax=Vagococcus fluvialis bH819 TaxID=1255619 RepID=A0A1X6WNX4_9ENTE|nr:MULTISPECIES: polysaccharide deacetylase family protein [Vagococcus]SLM85979.1 Polysaccharide deacetylase [Vagococcus fluvialis bH819]HCM88346.1 polysaccharide deacetylase family protein [Vagococcus sp.]
MKKKWVWLLLFLLVVEVALASFIFINPFKTKEVVKNTPASSEITTTTQSDTTSSTKEDIKWIESDTEINFPILMYHSLTEPEGNSLKVPPIEFEEHMKWLKDNGYYTLTPEEAYIVLTENKKPAEKIVWVTLDDGYLNNYTDGFPILKKLEINATINYITSKLGSANYFDLDQMKEMSQSKYVNIESHTVSHLDLNTLEDNHIITELKDSKSWLDKELNQETALLCYPAGRYDDRVKKIAQDAGYKMAVTTEPGYAKKSDGLFGLKRVRISPGYTGEAFGQFITSYE